MKECGNGTYSPIYYDVYDMIKERYKGSERELYISDFTEPWVRFGLMETMRLTCLEILGHGRMNR